MLDMDVLERLLRFSHRNSLFSSSGQFSYFSTLKQGTVTVGVSIQMLSVKVLSHPGHEVQVESKATGLSVGS